MGLEARARDNRRKKRGSTLRRDASESAFFSRELEYVEKEVTQTDYPELIGRDLIPKKDGIPVGAETYTYYEMDRRGAAKFIADYANDVPLVDVYGKINTSFIRPLAAAFSYNIQEIEASKMSGMHLDTEKADACRQAIEEKIDATLQIGDALNNLLGIFNQPNATVYTVPNGAAGSPTWALKTADEILKDLNGIATAIYTATKGTAAPDTVIIPQAPFALISSLRIPQINVTVLKFFLDNTPWVKAVVPWYAATGKGSGGTDRMVAYKRDPKVLFCIIPLEFEMRPPQEKGLAWEVPCWAKTGGVVSKKPVAIGYGDGI